MRCVIRMAVVATAMLVLVGICAWPVTAASAQDASAARAEAMNPTDFSAQRRPRQRRAPARIRVYPLPYSYPGPNAVRQCTSWLAQEYRPSGTVIVPRMRCWWERG